MSLEGRVIGTVDRGDELKSMIFFATVHGIDISTLQSGDMVGLNRRSTHFGPVGWDLHLIAKAPRWRLLGRICSWS